MSRSVSTVLFHGQNFGHGIVQCSPTLTFIQDLFQPNSWQTPVAAVTVYSAAEDGRKRASENVEHTCSFARVASCWFIIYYRLVMHGNSNIKKRINNYLTKKQEEETRKKVKWKENKQDSEEGKHYRKSKYTVRFLPWATWQQQRLCRWREHTDASYLAWHPVWPRLCRQNSCWFVSWYYLSQQ